MNSKELFQNIVEFCQSNADQNIIKRNSRFFKGGFIGYGLLNEHILAKVKEYRQQNWCNTELVYEVSRLLVREEKFELPSFALLLLYEFKKDLDFKSFKEIENWFSLGIDNWAHTDGICQYFFPVFWKKEIIQLRDLSTWRKAKNKYQRRCVPVSMIKLLKHSNNYDKMFKFIDPMMTDMEREVHQGLGWFLRECWKRERHLTEAFLMKWKNDCARLIIQYATEKMTKDDKLRFRKEKK